MNDLIAAIHLIGDANIYLLNCNRLLNHVHQFIQYFTQIQTFGNIVAEFLQILSLQNLILDKHRVDEPLEYIINQKGGKGEEDGGYQYNVILYDRNILIHKFFDGVDNIQKQKEG